MIWLFVGIFIGYVFRDYIKQVAKISMKLFKDVTDGSYGKTKNRQKN